MRFPPSLSRNEVSAGSRKSGCTLKTRQPRMGEFRSLCDMRDRWDGVVVGCGVLSWSDFVSCCNHAGSSVSIGRRAGMREGSRVPFSGSFSGSEGLRGLSRVHSGCAKLHHDGIQPPLVEGE